MSDKTPADVEDALQSLIEECGLEKKLSVQKIQQWVYHADGETVMEASNQYLSKCFKVFPDVEDIDGANRILGVLQDVWNYFPHKDLGGKSPQDLVEEHRQAAGGEGTDDSGQRSMPKVIVGGVEMEWDEYQDLLLKIEQEQVPFKMWIDEDVLPAYKKFLSQKYTQETRRENEYMVAEFFCRRVLHVGFVHVDLIHPAFVQTEFPAWWPSHVLFSNKTPEQIRQSLKRFFSFLELLYDIDPKQFGFV